MNGTNLKLNRTRFIKNFLIDKIADESSGLASIELKINNNKLKMASVQAQKTQIDLSKANSSSEYIIGSFNYNLELEGQIKRIDDENRGLENDKKKKLKIIFGLMRKKVAISVILNSLEKAGALASDEQMDAVAQEFYSRNRT